MLNITRLFKPACNHQYTCTRLSINFYRAMFLHAEVGQCMIAQLPSRQWDFTGNLCLLSPVMWEMDKVDKHVKCHCGDRLDES